MPRSSEVVGEDQVADVAVRYLEIVREDAPYFYAAGAPIADEWCYLADADDLRELELGCGAILADEVTGGIFVRCAALLGFAWDEDLDVVALLDMQMHTGMELLAAAPRMAQASPEALRRLRD